MYAQIVQRDGRHQPGDETDGDDACWIQNNIVCKIRVIAVVCQASVREQNECNLRI